VTIQKISAIASATLLAGGLLVSAMAQAQPGPQRYDDRHDNRPPPARMERRAPPPPPMAVGRSLPRDYRGYNYRVDNWNYYHLPRPRPGQYWVQYGPQFVLTNPAGIVLQVFVP